jgi:hypothetical protein
MATDAELQAALTFANNHSGVTAKTVNAAQLARIKAWYAAAYPEELNGEAVTADDIAAWLWRQVNAQVTRRENALRDAANELAAVTDLTA